MNNEKTDWSFWYLIGFYRWWALVVLMLILFSIIGLTCNDYEVRYNNFEIKKKKYDTIQIEKIIYDTIIEERVDTVIKYKNPIVKKTQPSTIVNNAEYSVVGNNISNVTIGQQRLKFSDQEKGNAIKYVNQHLKKWGRNYNDPFTVCPNKIYPKSDELSSDLIDFLGDQGYRITLCTNSISEGSVTKKIQAFSKIFLVSNLKEN